EQGAGGVRAPRQVPCERPVEHGACGEPGGGAQVCESAEAREGALVAQGQLDDGTGHGGQWFEEAAPGGAVGTQVRDRALQVAMGERGGGIVQRLRVGHVRGAEVDAAGSQVEGAEEGARDGQRMDRRAQVVGEAGSQAQVEGAGTAAGGGFRFEDEDAQPCAGQGDGGGQPVGAGADDDGVEDPGSGCGRLCAHTVTLAATFSSRRSSPSRERRSSWPSSASPCTCRTRGACPWSCRGGRCLRCCSRCSSPCPSTGPRSSSSPCPSGS